VDWGTIGLQIPVRLRSHGSPGQAGQALGFLLNDKGTSGSFSAAPTALIIFGIEPQPFRAGLTFGGLPSGPRIYGEFAVLFLSQLAVDKSAVRDDKAAGGVSIRKQIVAERAAGSCLREGRTAGPSATLGMTKGRMVFP
jgi:hypothetical protein